MKRLFLLFVAAQISFSAHAFGDREQGALVGGVIGYILGRGNTPQPVYAPAPHLPPPGYAPPAVHHYHHYSRPPVVYRYNGDYQLPPAKPEGYYIQEDYYDPSCGCNIRIYR